MALIVQKFGGTSVADSEKILAAARKAIRAHQQGNQVVMVVSAMGKNTDMLIGLSREITDRPSAREMDMLLSTGEQVSVALMAMAVHSLGHEAVSLTGAQIGIRTDSKHTKARIKSISTERVENLLNEGHVVIAAGFQGIDEDFNVTTLGRGGSDTTAVALAAVLQADTCEIYTDVDGVYTTDPRLLPEARQMSRISYDEMLEMASLGAGVMHNRSIEFAKKFRVPIHVRSSLSDAAGTMIVAEPESADYPVCGAAMTKDESRVTLRDVPDIPGASLELFSRIAECHISVDMIVQNVGDKGKADISFTVPRNELRNTLEALERADEQYAPGEILSDDDVAKVSVVGLGMAQQSGVARQMFRALAGEDINIQMISTSEIKISTLVQRDSALDALRAVHAAFELEREPSQPPAPIESQEEQQTADAALIASRLRGVDMEELMIDDLSLDESQASITIRGVPDTPGVAATIFEEVAAAGVFVDMIVQSYDGRPDQASLSFTVLQERLDRSIEVANRLAERFRCQSVTHIPRIAKLSVSGVGLRSHTDVAIRMFRALASAEINVEMINTSEVRVNFVVDGHHGREALGLLQDAFSDAIN
jgi:aspartate kinase